MKPLALPPNPTVAVLAPASSARQDRIESGAARLRARGWELHFYPSATGKHPPYFSALAGQRLQELHAAFAEPEFDGILASRGGYGSNYLLPGLDLDLIRAHRDATALQSWLLDRTGLVAFHAPMLAADWCREGGVDEASFAAVVGGELHTYAPILSLQGGEAEGTLYGGCLSLLCASLGTPYAPQIEGKLLFLEDVGAKPYQVDRMLRQLLLAGKLDRVPGILFGEMIDCTSPGGRPELLREAILHALDGFAGPIAFGLASGHVSGANLTLPFGVRAHLEAGASEANLRLLEPAVRMRS